MVQRRHLEDALAVGQLEVAHLDDVGQRLADVDDAHQNQHQRHIVGKGQRRHRAAQKQRPGVAHEHLGGVVVIHQKAQQTAHQRAGEHAQLLKAGPYHRHHQEEQTHRHGDAGAEAVQPVGDVHGVHGAGNDQHGEDEVDHPGQVQLHPKEGHIEVGGQDAAFPQQDDEQDGRCQLEQELLPGGQARVLFLFDLGVVVQKADGPKDQGKDQDDHARPIPG